MKRLFWLLYVLLSGTVCPAQSIQPAADSIVDEASLPAYLRACSTNFLFQEYVDAACPVPGRASDGNLIDTVVAAFVVSPNGGVVSAEILSRNADAPYTACLDSLLRRAWWWLPEWETPGVYVRCRREFILDRTSGKITFAACLPGRPAYHAPIRTDTVVFDQFDLSNGPTFPGGRRGEMMWLAARHAAYPSAGQRDAVVLTFVVDRLGRIGDVRVVSNDVDAFLEKRKKLGAIGDLQEVSGSSGGKFSARARELVAQMPAWHPGRIGVNPVRVRCLTILAFDFLPHEARTDTLAGSMTVDTPASDYLEWPRALFPGGDEGWRQFLERYHPRGIAPGPKTHVYLTFTVEEDGRLTNVTATMSASAQAAGYGRDALRLTEQMPRWIPPPDRERPGRNIRGRMTLTLTFPKL